MNKVDLYNKFGIYLKRFCLDNYKTINHAAECLYVNSSYLSQVIHCHRPPSEKLRETLINKGFDKNHFIFFDAVEKEKIDIITYDELKFLYLEVKRLLEEKNHVIQILEERIDHFRKYHR